MVIIELVEQGDGERGSGEDGGRRRRRFGRRSRAEAASEGANRAERRAALRRRGPAPTEPEAALAGEDLDEDVEVDELDEERPAVPTGTLPMIEAGVTAAGDEDEDEGEAEAEDARPGVAESGADEDEPASAQADDDAAETAEDEGRGTEADSDTDEDPDRNLVAPPTPPRGDCGWWWPTTERRSPGLRGSGTADRPGRARSGAVALGQGPVTTVGAGRD